MAKGQESQKGTLLYSLSAPEGAPLPELSEDVSETPVPSGFGIGSLGFIVIVLLEIGDYFLIPAHLLSDLGEVEQEARWGLIASKTLRMGPTHLLSP